MSISLFIPYPLREDHIDIHQILRTAIESLLKKGFKPARSIVLAYGIDEERGGVDVSHTIRFPLPCSNDMYQGARYMKDYLLDTYGRDSFAMLVDEGGKSLREWLYF